jgi:hypothetical protein
VSQICDRSPCDSLLDGIGVWLFYDQQEGFYQKIYVDGEGVVDKLIEYCPFCGTRLSEVGCTVLERYMKPRKRRRVIRLQG